MLIFNERGRAFENQYINQREIYFQIIRLRNKLFAKWVAEHMELDEQSKELYVEEIGKLISEGNTETTLLRRAMTDLNLKGGSVTLDDVHKKLNECYEFARQEFLQEHF